MIGNMPETTGLWGQSMASAHPPLWRETVRHGARRTGALIAAMALGAACLVLAGALLSYRPSDPAWSTAAGGPPRNWLGTPGALIADALLSLLGLPVALLAPLLLLFASRLWRDVPVGAWRRMLAKALCGMVLIGAALALLTGGASDALPAGQGGTLGLGLALAARAGLAAIGDPQALLWATRGVAAVIGLGGIALYAMSYELDASLNWRLRLPRPARAPESDTDAADSEEEALEAPRAPAVPRARALPDERPAPVIAGVVAKFAPS